MAARCKILYDKTEIVVMDTSGKKAQVLNLTYDKVVSIQFDKCVERSLLRAVPSEKISITVRGRETPVVFFKGKEKEFFEQYKADLTRFAKDNRVSFHNNL